MKLMIKPAALVAVVAGAAGLVGLTSHPARAAEEFYTFKSMLSTANANWCLDVPNGDYQNNKKLQISACSGKPNQTYGYEVGGTLTIGGFCVDAPETAPNPAPSAGDAIAIAQCDGTNHQIWELTPFKSRPDVFAIANLDGLCITVDGAAIGEGSTLSLAQCAEMPTQGWLSSKVTSVEREYYWYGGHEYCWYDGGWHGGGWYWCGENLHVGIGWGGPIGWHWWHHHGHPPHPHPHPIPVPHPHPHPIPPHPIHPLPHPHPVPHPIHPIHPVPHPVHPIHPVPHPVHPIHPHP
jgi:hypothetical protein